MRTINIRTISESEIEDTILVCPYCGTEVEENSYKGHCGESSDHFEKAYIVGEDILLESEVIIIKGE